LKESLLYYSLKIFGVIVRLLPYRVALWTGKLIGIVAYYVDIKHRTQAYSNLRLAFEKEKSPQDIKAITKGLFLHFGQHAIELLRMPLLNKNNFEDHISVEGRQHLDESLKKGKGVILLAMHFGSWELASISCAILGYPYKVFVKPQERYSKLNDLLNSPISILQYLKRVLYLQEQAC